MSRPLAVLLLVICTMLWGFAFVAQKTAMGAMGPLTFSAVRYLLGALLVAPFAVWEYRRRQSRAAPLTRGQWVRIGILSLAFFLGVWSQQAALQTTTATDGGFLTSLYVIFTPIVTYLTVRARPHPIVYAGAPLALVGIYLLTGARFDAFTTGDFLLLLCAVCWAVQVSMLGTLVRETNLPIAISTINFLATALLATIGALVLEHPTFGGIGAGWIEILYSGVMSTAIAFSLQAIGQQYVPPANAAIILSAESLFSALGGALLLGERLPPLGYAGAALIFAAIVMVETIPAWRARRASTSPGSA
ncbi:MAG TPA: DMT family transporter [Devosia sp.]|jgi:drug/metabolite transporter (DMT)-like permease|nr:DMT family transporter [Devosia sp.]